MWTELPQDIIDELTDPSYVTRSHYSRSTYAHGCHGPLCRKAERDRGRVRTEKRAKESGRDYIPNMALRNEYDDDWLWEVIQWHRTELALRRLTKSA